MGRYVVKRIFLLVPVLLGVSIVVFSLVNVIPGDPISIMLGANPQLPPDPKTIALLRHEYGLDQPLVLRYLGFLARAVRGDFGHSIITQQPVLGSILERYPATLLLSLASLVLSVAIALPAGIISATRPYSWVDTASMFGAMLGVSMPGFWLGLILMLVFSLYLRWLPVSGMGSLGNGLWNLVSHLIMPAVTLGLGLSALLTRMTRSSLLEVLRQDYVRTAHAKGLAGPAVIRHHALRNAALPILTVIGFQFGYLLGGSVIIETIFAWPGIGRLAVNAIWQRDLPVIQGTVLAFTLTFVLVNLAVDLLYAWIDPRIHYD